MSQKTTVGLIYGGKSPEHEVSLRSAKNIYDAIPKDTYEVILIPIDKNGAWYKAPTADFSTADGVAKQYPQIIVVPGQGLSVVEGGAHSPLPIDVGFPVLHGPNGEDGTIQGMLTLLDIPFVGAGVLGSAVGMDKDVMKRLLTEAGIANARAVVATMHNPRPTYADVSSKLGKVLFIKPANMGSSVGVSKATNEVTFEKALDEAFKFDTKILIEEAIVGREIECAVLGGITPTASLPGEIIVGSDFYSYEEKYNAESTTTTAVPPENLPQEVITKIQETAVKAFTTLCCEGLGRVDSFYTNDGRVIVNEINTLPGFTSISLYPVMWEKTGLPQSALVTNLIEDAVRRGVERKRLQTSK
jgi:D-alanine-D-alanine ligase